MILVLCGVLLVTRAVHEGEDTTEAHAHHNRIVETQMYNISIETAYIKSEVASSRQYVIALPTSFLPVSSSAQTIGQKQMVPVRLQPRTSR